jgi:predicted nucleic acid-binding protein
MELKKHRIFLDSNVIMSGLFSEKGAPRLILDLLTLDLPVLAGLTGRLNLLEIERDIGKKMPDALSVWQLYLPQLRLEVFPTPSSWDLALLGDAAEGKDLSIVASASNGKADHFVSGDERLLSRLADRTDLPFRTSAPAEFLNDLLPLLLRGKR